MYNIRMASTTHDDKTEKVGLTLLHSLVKQTKCAVTFQEAHISAEQSRII
jgi:hypothetical protein